MSANAIKFAADSNIDLIPPPYDELYKALGFEAFSVLFDYFGSQHVYIPSMRNILSECIKTEAIKECESRVHTHEQIARKYGYSGRYFRKLLRGK